MALSIGQHEDVTLSRAILEDIEACVQAHHEWVQALAEGRITGHKWTADGDLIFYTKPRATHEQT